MSPRNADIVAQPKDPLDFGDLAGLWALVSLEASDENDVDPQTLRTLLAALPELNHDAFWKRVLNVAGEYLHKPPPPPNAGGEDKASDEGEGDGDHVRTVYAVSFALATYADVALGEAVGRQMNGSFVETLGLMQEMLLSIPDSKTQALIARALEKIVCGQFEGREDFYGGALMYMIGGCLAPKASGSDVSRLYRVRHLFADLDWEHESIDSMKLQIMRCAASPTFVRANHGSDLISLFFTVHPSFTSEVHGTVKNQMMYCRPASIKGYAVALFKAWKQSEGGTRVQMELSIQDWVVMAIRTARKSAERARNMLEEFHRHHHDDQINELLCKLYGPVLWRSLKVANSQVRENAARLLQYVFPLIPNDLGVSEKEQELARQLRVLRETLEDPAESVRRTGVGAVSSILKNYWDMMPSSEIAELLTLLRDQCSHDRRSPTVRAAVAEGFSWIVQNPMSHPTMVAVLPALADLLNDRSPLVRAAFVNLLQTIAVCKGISVNSIVSNDALLLRLAAEHTEGQMERLQKGLQKKQAGNSDVGAEVRASPEMVAKKLTKLMSPSLFVQDIVQQVARCDYFMKHSPLALLAMLTHAPDFVSAPERVKLAAALFRYGLREASNIVLSNGQEPPRKNGAVTTMLRVVGVLLEGALSEVPKKRKQTGDSGTPHFPKELESFVYEHIREEDFLHLLKATHEDQGVASQLREDLLYALSSLDPARLVQSKELVEHELNMACRTNQDTRATAQLAALMRTAMRWNLLGSSLEAAWERLQAAAARLSRRQAPTEELESALAVAEIAFRDPDVRRVMLRTEAGIMKDIIGNFVAAFQGAWSAGLVEALDSKNEAFPVLLGERGDIWPRILGFTTRAALHLDHRMALTLPVAANAAANEPVNEPEEPQRTGPFHGLAESTLEAMVSTLTGEEATSLLRSLEGRQVKHRRRTTKSSEVCEGKVPTDIGVIVKAIEKVLESCSAANFLAVLKISVRAAEKGIGQDIGSGFMAHIRTLEDYLWRWCDVADGANPEVVGEARAKAWALIGRIVQQMANSEITIPDVITAIRSLLRRVTDEIPQQCDLQRVVLALCTQLEYEPQMVELVAGIIGAPEIVVINAQVSADSIAGSMMHARVRETIEELLPNLRNLRARLRPQEALQPLTDDTKRRVLESATPQHAHAIVRRSSAASILPDEDVDGQSLADTDIGRRSFSVRSRSPPPASESLFDDCFARGASADGGSRPASEAVTPVA